MVNEIYIRNCPNCNIEITYKTISARNLANREVRKCNICHRIGKGFTGKHHNKISKKKISNNLRGENNYMFGKTHSDEIKLKISENMPDQCGENNSFFGKHHSIKTKRKIGRINKNNKYSLGLKRSDASCKK